MIFQKPIQNAQKLGLLSRLFGRSLCLPFMGSLLARLLLHEVRAHSVWRSSTLHREDIWLMLIETGAGLSPSDLCLQGRCISHYFPRGGSCCVTLPAWCWVSFRLTHRLPTLEGFGPNISVYELFLMGEYHHCGKRPSGT